MTVQARFWSKVDKSGECWLWQASTRSNGYGQINIGGRNWSAHRLAWTLTRGPIPEGLIVDHICRVRSCVRPDHLRLTTKKQNCENRDDVGRGRSGIRGVRWDRSRGLWAASVCHNGITYNAGRFVDKHEAAAAARTLRNQLFTHNTTDRI